MPEEAQRSSRTATCGSPGTPDELITTQVDVTTTSTASARRFAAHVSQNDPNSWFTTMADQIYELAFGTEYYRLARGQAGLRAARKRPVRGLNSPPVGGRATSGSTRSRRLGVKRLGLRVDSNADGSPQDHAARLLPRRGRRLPHRQARARGDHGPVHMLGMLVHNTHATDDLQRAGRRAGRPERPAGRPEPDQGRHRHLHRARRLAPGQAARGRARPDPDRRDLLGRRPHARAGRRPGAQGLRGRLHRPQGPSRAGRRDGRGAGQGAPRPGPRGHRRARPEGRPDRGHLPDDAFGLGHRGPDRPRPGPLPEGRGAQRDLPRDAGAAGGRGRGGASRSTW